jgi:DNA-directed RNA polymerase subunit beta
MTEANLVDVPRSEWGRFSLTTAEDTEVVEALARRLEKDLDEIETIYREKIAKLTKGDELPPGVIKMVKVYVAIKRKLQVGDKMAGRHGNKGVVSRVLPEEDMPYLENGRPVDMVLNPLGVPSRMNIGQILETHLGWAAKGIGERLNRMIDEAVPRKALEEVSYQIWDDAEVKSFVKGASDEQLKDFIRKYKEGVHFANPVFDGANEAEIRSHLELSGVTADGQTDLYDGRTGAKFDNRVTVGVMYVLKLHHLVDEKIHARSIGPYSLVTQQPLGGKAQFGGQRLGEMEVWAMEAYGAAHTLQEFLTVKSDDVLGRTRMYESIVKGTNLMSPGLPESFNVLVKELQSLGLDVNLIRDDGQETGLEGLQQ